MMLLVVHLMLLFVLGGFFLRQSNCRGSRSLSAGLSRGALGQCQTCEREQRAGNQTNQYLTFNLSTP